MFILAKADRLRLGCMLGDDFGFLIVMIFLDGRVDLLFHGIFFRFHQPSIKVSYFVHDRIITTQL